MNLNHMEQLVLNALVMEVLRIQGCMTESWDGSSWTEVADLAQARLWFRIKWYWMHISSFFGGVTQASEVYHATEEWSFTGLDPSTTPAADYADAIVGDFYYNSTTGQFKNISRWSAYWILGIWWT